jgi:hypothetical protein
MTAAQQVKQISEVAPLPVPGTFMESQGGFFVGVVMVDGARFGFVVAPKALGSSKGIWGERGKRIEADHFSDGVKNTQAMLANKSPIAKWATALDINGFQDWYIPARDELELCYRNLKPGDGENYASFRDGENPSSVPQGLLYIAESPAQTAVAEFMKEGAEAFDATWHWSSTQSSANHAFIQDFSDGFQCSPSEGYDWRVRAVRRFIH